MTSMLDSSVSKYIKPRVQREAAYECTRRIHTSESANALIVDPSINYYSDGAPAIKQVEIEVGECNAKSFEKAPSSRPRSPHDRPPLDVYRQFSNQNPLSR